MYESMSHQREEKSCGLYLGAEDGRTLNDMLLASIRCHARI